MKIQEILERFGYQLTGASQYCWQCYGDNAWRIEYDEGVEFIYDHVTQELFEVNVWCEERQESLIYVVPEYEVAHIRESEDRGFPVATENRVFSSQSIFTLAEQAMNGQDLDLDLCNYVEIKMEGDVYDLAKTNAELEGVSMETYVEQAIEEWYQDAVVKAEELGITMDEYLIQTYAKDVKEQQPE